ncbi:hypothetical protein Hanom_Chr17g01536671 [Helianthus anomalus]
MSSISSFEEGQSLSVSLKLGVRGELTDLALSMLNLRSTFSMYCSCDMCNFFEALSLVIRIPRICFAGPKSFIENDLINSFFS